MDTTISIKQSQSLNIHHPRTLSSPHPSQHNCWDFGTQCCKRYSWRGVTQASYFVIQRHFMIHGSLPTSELRTSLLIFPLKWPSRIGLEMCVKGYPGGWTTEQYYNIWGGMERAAWTQQMPQHRSQISERSNMFLRHPEEGKFLIHCPALHTSLFLYSSPFDNSSLSQAIIASNLCQLVAQLLSFLEGFQPPLQRRWGWEFGRGLILILTVQITTPPDGVT